jgi:hypothetical protein
MDMYPAAARGLARTLNQLADAAEKAPPKLQRRAVGLNGIFLTI